METKTGRIGKKIGVVRTPNKISIRLTTEQRDWLDTKGNRSAYITGLIDRDIISTQWPTEYYLDKWGTKMPIKKKGSK